MATTNAFYRSQLLMSALLAAVGSMELHAAFTAAEGYKSRGHGGKHKARYSRPRVTSRSASRYAPHQGKAECARRVAQRERAHG